MATDRVIRWSTAGAWPVVALVGSYEFLMMAIRSSQVPADGAPATGHDADPLPEWRLNCSLGT